jgi:hypothetical protein
VFDSLNCIQADQAPRAKSRSQPGRKVKTSCKQWRSKKNESTKENADQIIAKAKKGLYANIQAKRKRIAKGSGEKMRKPGAKGAPTASAFRKASKTAKKK